jgi:hypothetical protein
MAAAPRTSSAAARTSCSTRASTTSTGMNASARTGCSTRTSASAETATVRVSYRSAWASAIGWAATCAGIHASAISAHIPSPARTDKAMAAPPMRISPAVPRAHAQEDAVIEITRPIKADRRAGIGRIVIVAVGTGGRYADADANLGIPHWRKSQRRDHSDRTN